MRPILFLDVDGVLNGEAWIRSYPRAGRTKEQHLDPTACRRLNRVITATVCNIVLSSSWRYNVSLAQMQERLRRRGCPSAKVIGATPTLHEYHLYPSMFRDAPVTRGDEIHAWLATNPHGVFAIVDDDDDCARCAGRVVKTQWATGLQDEHVEKLIALLNEKGPK